MNYEHSEGYLETPESENAIFDIPVCDIFEPKLRNDQLCYETDLEQLKVKSNEDLMKQMQIGLVLILDYNEDRQMYFMTNNSQGETVEKKKKIFNFHDDNPAFTYFDTIS